MTKLLIGLLSLALVGTGGLVAAVGGFGGVDPAAAVSFTTPAATTTTGETTTEARTTEATTTGVTTEITSAAPSVTGGAVEVSGPCDEAEHADDPRCTGSAGGAEADDGTHNNEGRGSSRENDDDREADEDRDHDRDDDSSGHGSGGRDDDNSVRGSDDD